MACPRVWVSALGLTFRFYTALHLTLCVLTNGNLANSIELSKARQRLASIGYVLARHYWRDSMHIGVGFGVARSDNSGMLEPPFVGRVTRELPTSFHFYAIYLPELWGVIGQN